MSLFDPPDPLKKLSYVVPALGTVIMRRIMSFTRVSFYLIGAIYVPDTIYKISINGKLII